MNEIENPLSWSNKTRTESKWVKANAHQLAKNAEQYVLGHIISRITVDDLNCFHSVIIVLQDPEIFPEQKRPQAEMHC